MSFAREVKKELLNFKSEECCQNAMTIGLLHGSAEVVLTSEGQKIVIKSHLSQLLRYLLPILRTKYQIDPSIHYLEQRAFYNRRLYFMEIDKAEKIISDFYLMPLSNKNKISYYLKKDCCASAFLRGFFISKGSINDPKKNNYHLEMLFKELEMAELAQTILLKRDITHKVIEKKEQYLLYIKKAEEISKFLAFVGANSGVFYFEDSRILRDLNNSVNRIMNCDIANVNKSLRYCQKQLEAIAFLEKYRLIENLTPRLQDTIKLRKEYPDASLSELSELSSNILGKHMSKSGISHCLTELMNYFEKVSPKSKDIGEVK